MTTGRRTDIPPESRTSDELGDFARKLTEITPVIVQVYDVSEQRLIFVNSRVQSLLGYSPEQYAERVTDDWGQLIHPSDQPLVEGALEKLSEADESRVVESTFRIKHVDGSYRWLSGCTTVFGRDEGGAVRSVLSALLDITENKRLERMIADRSMQEQRRLGRELHDTVGQQVTAIGFMARSLQQKLAASGLKESEVAATIVESSDQAKQQVRVLTKGLMPVEIDAHGLAGALDDLAEQLELVYKVRCRVETEGKVALEDNTIATHLYKIAQEATLNAIKHGKARNLTVQAQGDDRELRLSIVDDGIGFDTEGEDWGGAGLHIMRYRAELVGGSLDVKSSREAGTRVTCTVPWEV